RKLAAEGRLGTIDENREIPGAVEAHEHRPVIGDEFREEGDEEDRKKDPQRPEAAPVAAKAVEAAPGERADRPAEKAVDGGLRVASRFRRSRHPRRSTLVSGAAQRLDVRSPAEAPAAKM